MNENMNAPENLEDLAKKREKVIVRTSVLGIVANVFLAAMKAAIGLFAHSIAVILDAVNNLTDVLSSVITVIGTKLAGKKPDKKHPFGHGRIEYFTEMIIGILILYAGITALVESIKKIITPEPADHSTVTIVILAAAIVVKLLLGLYVRKKGKEVNSGSLKASGTDALFDAILTMSVLVSAGLYLLFKINIEAYVGILISAFIIKSGIETLFGPVSELLGKREDSEFMHTIRETVMEDPDVHGVYDLILHDYGPENHIGSVHVEVDDTMTATEIDRMERRIAENVFLKHGVAMTGIGIYTRSTSDEPALEMRNRVTKMVTSHDGVLQVHGFFADIEKKTLAFDVILDFGLKNRDELFAVIEKEVREAYPDYDVRIQLDLDV